MISTLSLWIFIIALFSLGVFFVWSKRSNHKRGVLHRLFLALALAYGSWLIPLIAMYFVDVTDTHVTFVLDCLMQPGGALCAPIYLCIAIVFVTGEEKMTRLMYCTFVIPIITVLMACTNELHHLYYAAFSTIRKEIVFGPYIIVSGAYNYLVLIFALFHVVRLGIKKNNALYWKQCVMLIISGLCPLLISMYATFSGRDVPITATPISFMATLVFCGIAIFRLHILDITPIANQHILNAISDAYLVLNEDCRVVECNTSFQNTFVREYGIRESKKLSECIGNDAAGRNLVFGMLTAIDSARRDKTHISYEQSIAFTQDKTTSKKHFVVDVSPLEIGRKIAGFVIIFKDVTQLRDSMKRLQASQERMMEQERFAFLGQMIGGIAHNLKTPIMSISGCISAAEALVTECEESLDDAEVTPEDFREIYGEMREWFSKVKESTSYMSDIITAIKGQATNISTEDEVTFTIDEMIKRSRLLMRHELLNSGIKLNVSYNAYEEISLRGDINNLVQVIGNLVNNAIFAQKSGGTIDICVEHDEENLLIIVKDRGEGISDKVMSKLFKSMVTSKGTLGTGLGLYISNAVIRTKFNGRMWCENREGGGSIFGISIPLDIVQIKKKTT
ncbi:MAG: PAS domain S-box protein [Clostridia bacterium]|nr:PAS domain S-box protein [Clostridia bacterium]